MIQGLKGNPLTSDIMQLYSEPNGTQKLLINLLDQLSSKYHEFFGLKVLDYFISF